MVRVDPLQFGEPNGTPEIASRVVWLLESRPRDPGDHRRSPTEIAQTILFTPFKLLNLPMQDNNSEMVALAVNETLDNQLKGGDPPETQQTLDRLISSGHSEKHARQLIADVLLLEMRAVMASGEPYDNARYTAALSELT